MTLLELYQNDAGMRESMTKIMMRRSRMRYRREALRALIRDNGFTVSLTMGQVYELHYNLHPNDARRVLKQNMTPRRK